MTDPFWSRWQNVLVETSLPGQFEHLESTGRLEHFRRAARKESGGFEGFWFNDSDVYKTIEACAYALAVRPKAADLRRKMDDAIEIVAAAQEPDGYLNTFFQLGHPELKWRNLHTMHEMYCGGHLIEAGVAVFENLGDRKLLNVGIRFADHVISIFGRDNKRGYCGHEEIELALLKLSRATDEPKYAGLSRWMVEQRGHRPSAFEPELDDEESMKLSPWAKNMLLKDGEYRGEYCQDHAPIRQHREVVGHAVRAMYFYIAAAELSDGLDDKGLEEALEATWANLTGRRMYVTAGIGPSASNEGFTKDFDLPNLSAYAETCASCGLVFWGHRMLEMTANSDYADVMERALYNGALSGISISGDKYFYTNPLESRGSHERTPWFPCACCPPNIARLIGSVGAYIAGASEDAFYIHIPAGFTAEATLNGAQVKLVSNSDYPWSGNFSVVVHVNMQTEFAIAVRIPEWSSDVSTEVPGAEEEADFESGYAVFRRKWKDGDVLNVEFEMTPQWLESDPRVRDNLGRAALTVGPLVYAVEEHDLGCAPQLFAADTDAEPPVQASSILGGIRTVTVPGIAESETFSDTLYAPTGTLETNEVEATFIPYYAWCNRGPNNMQVWVRKL